MTHFDSPDREAQLQMSILDQLPDAVILLDRTGRIAYWNRTAEQMFHLAERAAQGKLPREVELDLWAGAEDEPCALQAARRPGGWLGQSVHANGHRKEISLESSIATLTDADGAPVGMVAVIRDVTAAKRRSLEQERLVEELRRALSRLTILENLIPICSHCKRARDEHGAWLEIDAYLSQRLPARFSHGICPACAQRLHPECFNGPDSDT
jgi:PAS domain S-box-containing protein